MKPEIEQKLLEYLTALESLMKDGKDLAIEQAPEVAREIVAYAIVSEVVWMMACASLAAVLIYPCVKVFKWAIKENEIDALPLLLFPLSGAAVLAAVALCHATDAAKAYFAPRLYVIDYLRSEVKK